jgi:hypothetical protein
MDLNNSQFNTNFLEQINTPEGQTALSAAGSQFIKTELMESAFSRAILPQQPITVNDCQKNVHDNSLYLLKDIEPDAAAVGVDNFGEPDGQYVKGKRYLIPIVNFVTKRFTITVEDLRAYQYRITKRIEEKSAPALEKLEDKLFLRYVFSALSGQPAVIGSAKAIKGADTVNDLTITAKDLVGLKNTLAAGINGADAKRKEVAVILMCQEAYETATYLPSAGDDFGTKRVIDGVKTDILYGNRIVKTIKSDILPVGHMLAFTAPDFLGHSFSLGDPQFEIRSQFGTIEWQTKESIGMGIGNILSIALCALKGSKAPGTNTSLEISSNGTIDAAILNYYKAFKI